MSEGTATLDELIQNRLTLLRTRTMQMRELKTGDIFYAQDYNVLVYYARENLELAEYMYQKIKEVEQRGAVANPSGISPAQALRLLPSKQPDAASWLYTLRRDSGLPLTFSIIGWVVVDEYGGSWIVDWNTNLRVFAELYSMFTRQSTTYIDPGTVPYICIPNRTVCLVVKAIMRSPVNPDYIGGFFYMAALRVESYPSKGPLPIIYVNGRPFAIGPDGMLYDGSPQNPVNVKLTDWFIIIAMINVRTGDVRVAFCDRDLNTLYEVSWTDTIAEIVPLLAFAEGSETPPTFNVSDVITLEYDWEIAISTIYMYLLI